MPRAIIAAIDYHLPAKAVTNDELALEIPGWTAVKITEKTGITQRHIAADGELSSDLAAEAARKLFARGEVTAMEIDFILFCTQTPDFGLPTSACLLQHRLGIPTTAGAIDFNLGCSGYIYGLSLAKGLIESGQAKCVLLLTGDTYSKLLDPKDRSVRTLFGDAGAATVVRADSKATDESIGAFVLGTDGSGGGNLVSHRGGWRGSRAEAEGHDHLWMNGPEIFNFTLKVVPDILARSLAQAGLRADEIDLFIFHQANRYILDHLRKKLGLPENKFVVAMANWGNTVSCSIPIAMRVAQSDGRMRNGQRVMLVGFGVGYSWGACQVRWRG